MNEAQPPRELTDWLDEMREHFTKGEVITGDAPKSYFVTGHRQNGTKKDFRAMDAYDAEHAAAVGWLPAVRKDRNMPWLRRGMRVTMDGKPGRVTGGNSMANIQVRFDGEKFSRNCHPHWQTVYFDSCGNVLADYRMSGVR